MVVDERRDEAVDAVLAMQQAIGNRRTAGLLAREKDKNRPSFEHSVRIGKLGPIEVTGGNVGDWPPRRIPMASRCSASAASTPPS